MNLVVIVGHLDSISSNLSANSEDKMIAFASDLLILYSISFAVACTVVGIDTAPTQMSPNIQSYHSKTKCQHIIKEMKICALLSGTHDYES